MPIYNLNFFTEYYQFYLIDTATIASLYDADFWNDEAGDRRLAIGVGLLGVTVGKYAKIKVKVKVLKNKPKVHPNAEHIVETSMNLSSGILQVKDCTAYDTVLELNLERTVYRIRISSFKLSSIVNDKGADNYTVEVWKRAFSETKVLKLWKA